jgi:hypothetical protein
MDAGGEGQDMDLKSPMDFLEEVKIEKRMEILVYQILIQRSQFYFLLAEMPGVARVDHRTKCVSLVNCVVEKFHPP